MLGKLHPLILWDATIFLWVRINWNVKPHYHRGLFGMLSLSSLNWSAKSYIQFYVEIVTRAQLIFLPQSPQMRKIPIAIQLKTYSTHSSMWVQLWSQIWWRLREVLLPYGQTAGVNYSNVECNEITAWTAVTECVSVCVHMHMCCAHLGWCKSI